MPPSLQRARKTWRPRASPHPERRPQSRLCFTFKDTMGHSTSRSMSGSSACPAVEPQPQRAAAKVGTPACPSVSFTHLSHGFLRPRHPPTPWTAGNGQGPPSCTDCESGMPRLSGSLPAPRNKHPGTKAKPADQTAQGRLRNRRDAIQVASVGIDLLGVRSVEVGGPDCVLAGAPLLGPLELAIEDRNAAAALHL